MGLRIFSVKRDGSYQEVPAARESFSQNDGAFLVVDRLDKKIYVYRKTGISSALAYSAGRAATNLNTIKGSKYKLINIEPEDRDRMLTEIIDKLDSAISSGAQPIEKMQEASKSYIYGEKTIPFQQMEYTVPISEPVKVAEEIQKREEISAIEILDRIKNYDVEEIVKTLASKILFETNIESVKHMKKPPRHQLRSELIKKIDALLDSIY